MVAELVENRAKGKVIPDNWVARVAGLTNRRGTEDRANLAADREIVGMKDMQIAAMTT